MSTSSGTLASSRHCWFSPHTFGGYWRASEIGCSGWPDILRPGFYAWYGSISVLIVLRAEAEVYGFRVFCAVVKRLLEQAGFACVADTVEHRDPVSDMKPGTIMPPGPDVSVVTRVGEHLSRTNVTD